MLMARLDLAGLEEGYPRWGIQASIGVTQTVEAHKESHLYQYVDIRKNVLFREGTRSNNFYR
jgi:hypothetical protein